MSDSDVLSLTLPKATSRSRLRLRRPRRPPPGAVWFVFWTLFCGLVAYSDFTSARPVHGTLDCVWLGVCWVNVHRVFAGRPLIAQARSLRHLALLMFAWVALVVGLDIVGLH